MNLPVTPRGARAFSLAALLFLLVLPCHAASAPEPVKLVVVVSVDGLSWPRLDACRPWYEAGFTRLLAESQVETSCFYRHLNTETGPLLGSAVQGPGDRRALRSLRSRADARRCAGSEAAGRDRDLACATLTLTPVPGS